jgi:ABC-type glycerol-3-phosphate transport system permease component
MPSVAHFLEKIKDRYLVEKLFNRITLYLAVGLFLFVILLPFYWILTSSFTPKFQMFMIPPRWFPAEVTFQNYVNLTENIPFFQYYGNSLIFGLASSFLSVILAFLAAYALARIEFPGSNIIFLILIISIAILLMSSLITPFTVWTMVSFIQQIPAEIEEAARIDGANLAQTLWLIVVPVVKPALATMVIINFIIAWNELLYPLVFATSTDTKTLSVGLIELAVDPSMGAGRPWDLMSAMSIGMIIPVLILVLFFQRLIVSGLTKGAIK